MGLEKVIIVEWEESGTCSGTFYCGYSLHKNKDDPIQYIRDYWSTMPEELPEEYLRPSCPLKLDEAVVTDNLYSKIIKSKNGIRIGLKEADDYIKLGELNILNKKLIHKPSF